MRLLVANYLKNGYNVVVEGPFLFERNGELLSFESDIDQLAALMRNLASKTLTVRLGAPEGELSRRAQALGREDEVASAVRCAAAMKSRYGARHLAFDTGATGVEAIVTAVREQLASEAPSP
jgi:hypothetical protein